MEFKDHFEGFEKEEKFKTILSYALDECPSIKDTTIKNIIRRLNPVLLKGLFERRPCNRKLKYTGCDCTEPGSSRFFKVGEIYESEDFNGGSYTIKGYEGKIGCAYFERVT